jgi:flagellin-like hook-associated protein FlgL
LSEDLKKTQTDLQKIQKDLAAVKKERDDLSSIAKRVTSLESINSDLTKKIQSNESKVSGDDLKKCQAELDKMKKEHQVNFAGCENCRQRH